MCPIVKVLLFFSNTKISSLHKKSGGCLGPELDTFYFLQMDYNHEGEYRRKGKTAHIAFEKPLFLSLPEGPAAHLCCSVKSVESMQRAGPYYPAK